MYLKFGFLPKYLTCPSLLVCRSAAWERPFFLAIAFLSRARISAMTKYLICPLLSSGDLPRGRDRSSWQSPSKSRANYRDRPSKTGIPTISLRDSRLRDSGGDLVAHFRHFLA